MYPKRVFGLEWSTELVLPRNGVANCSHALLALQSFQKQPSETAKGRMTHDAGHVGLAGLRLEFQAADLARDANGKILLRLLLGKGQDLLQVDSELKVAASDSGNFFRPVLKKMPQSPQRVSRFHLPLGL